MAFLFQQGYLDLHDRELAVRELQTIVEATYGIQTYSFATIRSSFSFIIMELLLKCL